jgi:riboflavin kinase/FMN adenylyltransferase
LRQAAGTVTFPVVLVLTRPGEDPPAGLRTVVTIGAYDGVHVGHRAVIAEVQRQAAARGVQSAVVTFVRHPAMVVRPASAPLLLTDLEQKLELLSSTGLDVATVVHFDQARSAEEPEDFIAELVECLGMRALVVGEDFHFGRGRRGNVSLLRDLGQTMGFDVLGIGLVGASGLTSEGTKVSSTGIRALLAEGRVDEAATLLGRWHEVRGTVEEGDRRGRDLGFPTANVAVPAEICLPADGIYAGWYVRPDGAEVPAAISLGRRPTFYEAQEKSLLEAHCLDFGDDLYGESARVRFVKRLRGEQKFPSVEALVEQMALDVAGARAALGS